MIITVHVSFVHGGDIHDERGSEGECMHVSSRWEWWGAGVGRGYVEEGWRRGSCWGRAWEGKGGGRCVKVCWGWAGKREGAVFGRRSE